MAITFDWDEKYSLGFATDLFSIFPRKTGHCSVFLIYVKKFYILKLGKYQKYSDDKKDTAATASLQGFPCSLALTPGEKHPMANADRIFPEHTPPPHSPCGNR